MTGNSIKECLIVPNSQFIIAVYNYKEQPEILCRRGFTCTVCNPQFYYHRCNFKNYLSSWTGAKNRHLVFLLALPTVGLSLVVIGPAEHWVAFSEFEELLGL